MDPVEELVAKAAIAEVVYRYCRALDRMDRPLAVSCWHPEGTADYDGLYHGSGEGFVDWVFDVHRQGFVAHSHQITNLLMRLDGERAVSEAYLTVALRQKGQEDSVTDIVGRGRYLDRWSKRQGRWALDHRHHVGDLQSIYQGLAVPETDGSARRGPEDPSYQLFGSLP